MFGEGCFTYQKIASGPALVGLVELSAVAWSKAINRTLSEYKLLWNFGTEWDSYSQKRNLYRFRIKYYLH
jgi:hypothetical protein